ncbi:MAG TPA: TraR/DksA C4-type zinc finger protein [Bryobacteraceae bacterium]|nr:TraR/DksA C4-type zinc finger protein [Bryobacteraceae bacterium]
MNLEHFRKRLLAKEEELQASIARLESEARQASADGVEDVIDEATSSEGKATAFEESSLEWRTLNEVRGALRRIEEGTFGTCIDCGRRIEPARLEAVPWTPYCLADQEKHDSDVR